MPTEDAVVPEFRSARAPGAPRTLLRAERLQAPAAEIVREPFPFLVATDVLEPKAIDALERDFPRYRGAGFFPHDPTDCGPSINALIDEITSTDVAQQLGDALGIERLGQYPTLVTLCRSLNRRHGNIHTDSLSKVATALVYLEPEWPHGSAGALRFLADANDIDALVRPEIAPTYGNFAIFRRTDCSYHGHLPFEGKRHVIQIAWLVDETEKLRKTKRGKFSRALKKVLGVLDAYWKRRA